MTQALLLGGGVTKPEGALEKRHPDPRNGLFDRHGFKRLHVAGHPEGNRDIDADGTTAQVDASLYGSRTFPPVPTRRWPLSPNSPSTPLPSRLG